MSDTITLALKFRILVEQLGGEVTENAMYLDGKGNQFSFKLKDKSFAVDLWDESIVEEFNTWHLFGDIQNFIKNQNMTWQMK